MSERTSAYDQYAPQLEELASLPLGHPRRDQLTAELTDAFRPVARNIARRFSRRGEAVDDLEQVAAIGLLHALRRFDPEQGRDFLSYAVPTMMGEVRRHFRDAAWAIRTPRGVKDRYLQVGTASTTLGQQLGRAPTATELAEHLGIDREEVIEAISAHHSYRPDSLDSTLTQGTDTTVADVLGHDDPDLAHVESRALVRDLVGTLPERERTILVLRFVHEKTQSEIAERLSISQMHVSRLLAQTLERLRERARVREATSSGQSSSVIARSA
ncbi:RNA polymerase sigma factor SigF [Actinomycetospora corticicola]|uniref:RNA polymerase sigma-B factor n=1 Tax=Actinomycetospora corticicola TaxID=663602 RepID=A0A7Y9DRB2_9PSEU|nr:RNA polymerase sigma-B factor [Actinomycetospora corticicola]